MSHGTTSSSRIVVIRVPKEEHLGMKNIWRTLSILKNVKNYESHISGILRRPKQKKHKRNNTREHHTQIFKNYSKRKKNIQKGRILKAVKWWEGEDVMSGETDFSSEAMQTRNIGEQSL